MGIPTMVTITVNTATGITITATITILIIGGTIGKMMVKSQHSTRKVGPQGMNPGSTSLLLATIEGINALVLLHFSALAENSSVTCGTRETIPRTA